MGPCGTISNETDHTRLERRIPRALSGSYMATPSGKWGDVSVRVRIASVAHRIHERNMSRLQAHGTATMMASSADALMLLKRWQQGDETMYEEGCLRAQCEPGASQGAR